MSIIEFLQFGVLSFFVLWFIFANLMTIKNKYGDKLPEWSKPILKWTLVVPFYICDSLFDIIYGTVLFLQLPNFSTPRIKYLPTFTERLRDIIEKDWGKEEPSWRFSIAMFICKRILEPWDPNHCGLSDLK